MLDAKRSGVVAISCLAGLTAVSVAAFSSTPLLDTTLIIRYREGKVDTIRLPKSTRLHQSNLDTTELREHSTFIQKRTHRDLEHIHRKLDSMRQILQRVLRWPSDHSNKLYAERERERFHEELDRLQQQLDQTQKEMDRIQSEIDHLQQDIDRMQAEIDQPLDDSAQSQLHQAPKKPTHPLLKDKSSHHSLKTFKLDTHFQQSFERFWRAFEHLQEHLHQWGMKQSHQHLRSMYEQNFKLLQQQLDNATRMLKQWTKLLDALKSCLKELRPQTNPRWQEDK